MKKIFITGGAGFIGSHLADVLIEKGYTVSVYDNLSLGRKEYLIRHLDNKKFVFYQEDLLNPETLNKAIKGHDLVFHLAASSDILAGTKKTDIDLKQGTIATYNVLEAMKLNGIKEIVFSSSSTVYGEAKIIPTQENYGPLFPISLYGAAKLAGEGLVSAFCHNFGIKAWIYRFANIVGERLTHGVIFDFINKLKKNPKSLEILGDGKQRKSYLYVNECIDGMLYGYENSTNEINYFNLGCDSSTPVTFIAETLVKEMGLEGTEFIYTGGVRGWSGDVPLVSFDVSKMSKLGWKAKLSSNEAIEKTIKSILGKD